jgi:hypothetical protein
MYKIKSSIILILIFCYINSYEKTQDTIDIGIVTSKTGLIIRENPTIKSKRLKLLPLNSQVEIIEYLSSKETLNNITAQWAKIRKSNATGWIFTGYLKIFKKFTIQEIISSLNKKEIIFRESDGCSGLFPSEYYTNLHLNPDNVAIYEYNSSTSLYCPKPIKPDCNMLGFNASTNITKTGKYKIINNSITISFNKSLEETYFNSGCCDNKYNKNIEKKINESFQLKIINCNFNGYERVALKGNLSLNKDFEFVLVEIK